MDGWMDGWIIIVPCFENGVGPAGPDLHCLSLIGN